MYLTPQQNHLPRGGAGWQPAADWQSALLLKIPQLRFRLLYFAQMESITANLPEDLYSLRKLNSDAQSGLDGEAGILELLTALPAPEEILKLRPSPRLASWVSNMLEKSRNGLFTPKEEEEWQRYECLEHLVRTAKAAAHLKPSSSAEDA